MIPGSWDGVLHPFPAQQRASGLPSTTGPGDYVDLWLLPEPQAASGDQQQAATAVAHGLIVSRIGDSGTGLLGGTSVSVEVRVAEEDLGVVLSAVAQDGALVLVPTGQEAP